MHKRVISFFLAIAMVLSLFGFSLSVSASNQDTAQNLGDGNGIEFSAYELDSQYGSVTVEVLQNGTVITFGEYPMNSGQTELHSVIYAGSLQGDNFRLRVTPRLPGVEEEIPVNPPITDAVVTFSAGAGGSISATIATVAIASGDMQAADADVVFTAEPNSGYVVASWTVNGTEVTGAEATATSITRTVGTGLDVVVEFEEAPQAPTLTVTRVTTGRVEPGDDVEFRATISPDQSPFPAIMWSARVLDGGVISDRINNRGETAILFIPNNVRDGATIEVTAKVTLASGEELEGSARVTVSDDDGGDWHFDGGTWRQIGGIIPPGVEHPEIPGRVDDRPPVGESDDEPKWALNEMTPAYLLYNDVPMNAWFHDFVTVVSHYRLMHGVGYRTFAPEGSMTRAMFIQVIANYERANLDAFTGGTPAFSDIAAGDWFYPAVQWAQNAGITTGVGEGYFAPNASITRQEMASLLNNYAKFRNIALSSGATSAFTDADSIADWAREDVTAIQAAGIIGGYPDGSFGPRRTATRAEVATIWAMFIPNSPLPPQSPVIPN